MNTTKPLKTIKKFANEVFNLLQTKANVYKSKNIEGPIQAIITKNDIRKETGRVIVRDQFITDFMFELKLKGLTTSLSENKIFITFNPEQIKPVVLDLNELKENSNV